MTATVMMNDKCFAMQSAIQASLSSYDNFCYRGKSIEVLGIDISGADIKCFFKDMDDVEHLLDHSDFEKAEYGQYSCHARIEVPDSDGGSVTENCLLENIRFKVVSHNVNNGQDVFVVQHVSSVYLSLL